MLAAHWHGLSWGWPGLLPSRPYQPLSAAEEPGLQEARFGPGLGLCFGSLLPELGDASVCKDPAVSRALGGEAKGSLGDQ